MIASSRMFQEMLGDSQRLLSSASCVQRRDAKEDTLRRATALHHNSACGPPCPQQLNLQSHQGVLAHDKHLPGGPLLIREQQ